MFQISPRQATSVPYGIAAAFAVGNQRENNLRRIVESEAEIEGFRFLWDS